MKAKKGETVADMAAYQSYSNLMTLNTFTGSMDESWFFTVTAAVEARGGAALYALLEAAAEALSPQPDLANMTRCLNTLGDEIGVMVTLLARIRANCDPHVFYNKVSNEKLTFPDLTCSPIY